MTRDITPAGSPATGVVDEAFAEVRASIDRFCLAAGAGLELAIARGWLRKHEPGTYVKFTQAGADVFA